MHTFTCLNCICSWKRGVDVWIHVFLTPALVEGEWSASRPGRFTPGQRAPGTHWVGIWVGPRAVLGDVEERKFLTLLGVELRPVGRPARSQSLYRLRYPGSKIIIVFIVNLRYSYMYNLLFSPLCKNCVSRDSSKAIGYHLNNNDSSLKSSQTLCCEKKMYEYN
jgi:hypothetical protein